MNYQQAEKCDCVELASENDFQHLGNGKQIRGVKRCDQGHKIELDRQIDRQIDMFR